MLGRRSHEKMLPCDPACKKIPCDGLQAVKRETRPGGFDAGSGRPEKYLRSEARKMLNPKCVTFRFSFIALHDRKCDVCIYEL